MSISKLLLRRRFSPLFWTQTAGAFNDNIFKNTMVIMLAYQSAAEASGGFLVNLAAAVFILPFFILSPLAGQIADKFDKGTVMRVVKFAEILIMIVGSAGFYSKSTPVLFLALFLLGVHSTFFGPVKYSILPQHLEKSELIAGNALVEMGTFLAILSGTILGGTLASNGEPTSVATWIMGTAILGWIFSMYIPKAEPSDERLKISFNFMRDMKELVKICRQREGIWNSVMGISWFWYFGSTILSQIPNYSKFVLNSANPNTTTVLLATFSICIGIGAILSEKLSGGEIELGLVPVGALGMSIFTLDFSLAGGSTGSLAHVDWPIVGITNVEIPWRVLVDLGMIGVSASLFIVPLYAYVQSRSNPQMRSRLIAGNNVFNALFMVVAALITMFFYQLKLSTSHIIAVTAVMNFVICTWLITLIPEFLMRFVVWLLASTIYRLKYDGRDLVPSVGPALIVCNHPSFIDWFIVTATCRRPVRYVMEHYFFKLPGLHVFAVANKNIPIVPAKVDAILMERSFELISESLRDGHVVCIFPEGSVTYDGKLAPFKTGVNRILKTDDVPVYMLAINGLWGSFFSRMGGSALSQTPTPSWRVISMIIKPFHKSDDPKAGTIANQLEAQMQLMVTDGKEE
jgi:1-acyl-sn-glycerol-3-phosphate acyltransferase